MMESFLQTYPNTVMKEDGLEISPEDLSAAQQYGADQGRRPTPCFRSNPNNLTALALLSYLDRAQALAGGADAAAVTARKPDNSAPDGFRRCRPRPSQKATPMSSGTP